MWLCRRTPQVQMNPRPGGRLRSKLCDDINQWLMRHLSLQKLERSRRRQTFFHLCHMFGWSKMTCCSHVWCTTRQQCSLMAPSLKTVRRNRRSPKKDMVVTRGGCSDAVTNPMISVVISKRRSLRGAGRKNSSGECFVAALYRHRPQCIYSVCACLCQVCFEFLCPVELVCRKIS